MVDESSRARAAGLGLELAASLPEAAAQRPLPLPWNMAGTGERIRFAHPAEAELGRILAFYGVKWAYEPTSFVLEWHEDGRPAESFTPDFYLPAHRLYLELTTMRQPLVTRKNRKLRKLRALYPGVRIKLLYRRDLERLFGAYRQPTLVSAIGAETPVVVDEAELRRRTAELADQIASVRSSNRNAASRLSLLAFDAGSTRFRACLADELQSRGVVVDGVDGTLARYGRQAGRRVARFACAAVGHVRHRDVLIVADIVSTGLSTGYVERWAARHGARSVEICTLFDRPEARLIDLDVHYAGFEAPDAPIAGFGIGSDPVLAALPMVVAVH